MSVRSLSHVKVQCSGMAGDKGQSKHCHGANADDTIIPVCLKYSVIFSYGSYTCPVLSSFFAVLL